MSGLPAGRQARTSSRSVARHASSGWGSAEGSWPRLPAVGRSNVGACVVSTPALPTGRQARCGCRLRWADRMDR